MLPEVVPEKLSVLTSFLVSMMTVVAAEKSERILSSWAVWGVVVERVGVMGMSMIFGWGSVVVLSRWWCPAGRRKIHMPVMHLANAIKMA